MQIYLQVKNINSATNTSTSVVLNLSLKHNIISIETSDVIMTLITNPIVFRDLTTEHCRRNSKECCRGN